ncbi:unnamed protein product [Pleuronectes platessa]|uniref:Uncharacterized protein n=1 Tax=Pleuronectes platessa TaxID=8262 RepID=A0A9N7THN4_PLEPL|nr:unnamed protein product [Pleuronectes platessa]
MGTTEINVMVTPRPCRESRYMALDKRANANRAPQARVAGCCCCASSSSHCSHCSHCSHYSHCAGALAARLTGLYQSAGSRFQTQDVSPHDVSPQDESSQDESSQDESSVSINMKRNFWFSFSWNESDTFVSLQIVESFRRLSVETPAAGAQGADGDSGSISLSRLNPVERRAGSRGRSTPQRAVCSIDCFCVL